MVTVTELKNDSIICANRKFVRAKMRRVLFGKFILVKQMASSIREEKIMSLF